MTEESNDNDVLSWLERRKKKKLQNKENNTFETKSNTLNTLYINHENSSSDAETR